MATHQGRKRKKVKAQKQPATHREISAFFLGVASVLDMGGTLHRGRAKPLMDEESAMRADAEALAGDWIAVGNSIREALGTYKTLHVQTDGA
jgi:hypothetical protein